MNTKLNHVQDWLALAQQANWSITEMARLCKVSVRTMERHFVKTLGILPKAWLTEQRQKLARELLLDSSSIKETAACLGYKYPTNFTRRHRGCWKVCPSGQMPSP